MRATTLAVLLALGLAAVAGGWYFGIATQPAEQTTVAGGQLMFPDLAKNLQSATKVDISHQGTQTVIEKRPDGGWGLAGMHDYPVQQAKLRGLLTGLTELRLTEQRTSDPAQLGRLGLEDPHAAGSAANLLQVMDAAGKPLAAVIVGHRRVRSQANLPDDVYVRRPDNNQAWLAEGSLQVDADPSGWLDRDIMNIAHDRVASVAVGDNALMFGRVDGKFTLSQPADHPKLEDYKVEDVARGLENLTLQAVKADPEVAGPETGHAVFTTNDGLAVRVTVLHLDEDAWARFAASATADKAKPEADRLNRLLAGWTYQIGSWKEKALLPAMDDLKAAEPEKPALRTSAPDMPQPHSDTPNIPAAENGSHEPSAPAGAAPGPSTPSAEKAPGADQPHGPGNK